MWENEVLSEENKCIDGIDYAFCWANTRQGNDFWLKLNNKWIKLIRMKCNE